MLTCPIPEEDQEDMYATTRYQSAPSYSHQAKSAPINPCFARFAKLKGDLVQTTPCLLVITYMSKADKKDLLHAFCMEVDPVDNCKLDDLTHDLEDLDHTDQAWLGHEDICKPQILTFVKTDTINNSSNKVHTAFPPTLSVFYIQYSIVLTDLWIWCKLFSDQKSLLLCKYKPQSRQQVTQPTMQKFNLQALVVEILDSDVLVSMPFMKCNDIVLDIPRGHIVISGKHIIPHSS